MKKLRENEHNIDVITKEMSMLKVSPTKKEFKSWQDYYEEDKEITIEDASLPFQVVGVPLPRPKRGLPNFADPEDYPSDLSDDD